MFLALFGTLFVLTQYLQSVLGYPTVKAGAVLLPQALMMMIFAPLSSGFVAKVGNKVVVTFRPAVDHGFARAPLDVPTDRQRVPSHRHHDVDGYRHGERDGAVHRLDHGFAATGKGRSRSAVNDTTRQMGGAIGVAVFGSWMAGHFTSGVATSLRSVVPADVLRQIGDNVGQAVGVANESPAAKQCAPQILAASKDAFVAGLHIVGSSLQLSRCSQRSVSQSSCRRGRRKTSRRPCRSSKPNPPDDRRRSPCEAWPAARSAARRGHPRISVGDVRRGCLPRDSIEGVAARAGVAKATVYRRYPTLAPLFVDAVRVRLCLIHELPDTGDLRADLLAMMQPLIDRLLTPDGAVLAALMTERFREPELAA